jgi:K+-sensing histidine kinase KdpD
VTIADRGHGISREGIRRLGELLFTTKGEAGTGLGLWVSYRIIAKYGGSIQVYSSTRSERNGTVFRICFADTNTIAPGRNQSNAAEMTSNPQRFEADRREGGEVNLGGRKLTA